MDISNKEDGSDKIKEGKCTMCKFVLIFAFAVLLLVLVFTFFFRPKPTLLLEPLAPELVQPLGPEAERQHLLNLGRILHPGLSDQTSSPVHLPVTSTHKTVTTHE